MASIVVIVGSIREGRVGIRVAEWVVSSLKERGHDAHLVDPLDHEELIAWKERFKMTDNPSESFTQLQSLFSSAEGFVLVSPEYNHSYPGSLKNTLDIFFDEYHYKPFGIVTYSPGGFGGMRSCENIRNLIPSYKGVAVYSSVIIPSVQEVFGDEVAGGRIQPAFDRMATELEWWVSALNAGRANGTP